MAIHERDWAEQAAIGLILTLTFISRLFGLNNFLLIENDRPEVQRLFKGLLFIYQPIRVLILICVQGRIQV
jgi:hypothetical protein